MSQSGSETIKAAHPQTSQACVPGSVRHKKTRGQSIVELGFVAPLLIVMIVIAGDLSRAYTAYLTVGSAASAGATFAMLDGNSANDAGIIAAAMDDAGLIWGQAPIVAQPVRGVDGFGLEWVEVTVTYEFSPVFRFWPIPGTIPVERRIRVPVLQS